MKDNYLYKRKTLFIEYLKTVFSKLLWGIMKYFPECAHKNEMKSLFEMSWPISSPGSSARVFWDRFQYGCYFEFCEKWSGSLIQTVNIKLTKSTSHKTDLTFVRRVTAHLIGLHSFQTQWSASPDKEMEGIGKEERSAVLSPSVTDEQ